MKRNKLTIDIVLERIRQAHGETVTLDVDTYVKTNVKARFIDVEFGEWWSMPYAVMNGRRHPERFRRTQLLDVNEACTRLETVHSGTVTLDRATFVSAYTRCDFIDVEYGHWTALPHNVLNGSTHPQRGLAKRKNTWLQIYGVDNPFKSKEVQDKVGLSLNKTWFVPHWRTQEALPCVSSYEYAFVNWCNHHQYDFDWQIWHTLSDGKNYRVDAFVKDGPLANAWVEIKGYLREDFKQKWELFKRSVDKALLLDRSTLIELHILTRSGRPEPTYTPSDVPTGTWRGYKLTDSARMKISESRKGKKLSGEHRKRLSDAAKRRWSKVKEQIDEDHQCQAKT